MYRGLVLIGLILCLGMVSAVEYTPTTDTICNNGVCTKTIYSGVRNVYEDNQWKRVEDARSLKNKGFKINYLENDDRYPVDVIDFNMTSITVRLNPGGFKVFSDNVPVRLWKNNNTKNKEFEKDVKDGKKQKSKKDYKEKMDKVKEEEIGFWLLNQEEIRTYDFSMGNILEFGFNSTTITLSTSGTIVDDTSYGSYIWQNPTNAIISDDSRAYAGCVGANAWDEDNISIVKNGVISGDNLANNSRRLTLSDVLYSIGNDSSLWGESWTAEDINNDSFGFVVSWETYGVGGGTHLLKATNWSASIPGGSTINGIQAFVEAKSVSCGPGDYSVHVDYMYLNITYSSTDTCTCAGVDTNWEIDLSDICTLSTPCNLGTGTLSFTGTGNSSCNTAINTTGLGDPGNGILYINSGCNILVS